MKCILKDSQHQDMVCYLLNKIVENVFERCHFVQNFKENYTETCAQLLAEHESDSWQERTELRHTTWLGVSDCKHIRVLHGEVLGIFQALRGMSLRRQKNAAVVNVLTGAHDGGAEVDPGISLVDSLFSPSPLYAPWQRWSLKWKLSGNLSQLFVTPILYYKAVTWSG